MKISNPLLDTLTAHGALLAPLAGFDGKPLDTAMDFGDVNGELAALDEGAAVVDLTARGLLVIQGEDRRPWLHGLCTQDIKGMGHGQGGYACHIDIKGRIMADMWVGAWEELLLLDVEPGVASGLRRALKRFIVMEKVKVVDRSLVAASLGLLGPRAAATLEALCGRDLSGLPDQHLAVVEVAGCECLVAATGQFGARGFRLTVARQDVAEVFGALAGAGARPCGWRALEAARVRALVPRFGAELGPDVLFNEADLGSAVSFTKGCYLGQEIVERVDARGRTSRRLMGLVFEGAAQAPPVGATLADDQRTLGSVTSAVALPDGRALGMGFVHRANNEPGARVRVQAPEGAWEAVLVERAGGAAG